MKNPLVCVSVILLWGFSAGVAAQNPLPSADTVGWMLSSSASAISRALEYTGFDKIEGDSCQKTASAQLVVAVNDNTPFWADSINGKPVWKVLFQNIPVGYGYTVMRKRDFEVTLEPLSGGLVRIYSIADDAGSSDTMPQPSAKSGEAFFGRYRFLSPQFAGKSCAISFAEALKTVLIANPAGTKIIRSYLAEYDDGSGQYASRWIIILHGIDHPLPAAGGYVPENQRNIKTMIIDAQTGKPLYAVNGPYGSRDPKREADKK